MSEDTRPDSAAPLTLIDTCMAAVHERIALRKVARSPVVTLADYMTPAISISTRC